MYSPGTGKSFIGTLLAKTLHDFSSGTILVVCYTNHALDQFLEDLLKIGIPEKSIVRLGARSTTTTAASLALRMQTKVNRIKRADRIEIRSIKSKTDELRAHLESSFRAYRSFDFNAAVILNYLQSSFEKRPYFDALCLPESDDETYTIERSGRDVRPDYLFDRWCKGQNAGVYMDAANVVNAEKIWQTSFIDRQAELSQWKEDMLKDHADVVSTAGREYNECLARIHAKYVERDTAVLKSKRIIGCTSTAAAKYHEQINGARPSIVLVEEAGETLESHILTAINEDTKQLILIGDHKYAFPLKVPNHFYVQFHF